MEVKTDISKDYLQLTHISWLRLYRVSDVAVVDPWRRHSWSGDQVQEDRQHHAAAPGWARDLRSQLQAGRQGARGWRSICLAPGRHLFTFEMK